MRQNLTANVTRNKKLNHSVLITAFQLTLGFLYTSTDRLGGSNVHTKSINIANILNGMCVPEKHSTDPSIYQY